MKEYGLIGFPLGHSYSEKYFTKKFMRESIDSQYRLYPLSDISELEQLLALHPEMAGFNVTIPYKQQIINYLDQLDGEAIEIGAVNVVKITLSRGGQRLLTGYNSDIYGFSESIKPLLKPYHKKALILGTGGASKAVAAGLKKFGITYKYVSRTKSDNSFLYTELDNNVLEEYTIIINCSPVGMSPHIDECPAIPYEYLTDKHLVYDLIYNPLKTRFLDKAQKQGATIKNGEEMLILQAEKAWEIWNK